MRRWIGVLGLLVLAGAARGEGLYERPVLRIETGMHTAMIRAIGADAAGRYILTASKDKTARVWSASDGKLLRVLRPPIGAGNEGKLYAGAISPDGRWIAVGGFTRGERTVGHQIYVFDRLDGYLMRRLAGPQGVVNELAFAPDGRSLAVTTGEGGLHVYDAETWRRRWSADACNAHSYGLAFVRGGLVQSCYDGRARRFSVDGALRATSPELHGREPSGVAGGPGGQIAVSFDKVSGVQILDAATLAPRQTLTPEVGNGYSTPTTVWAGSSLWAAGGLKVGGRHGVVRWLKPTGAPEFIPLSNSAVYALAPLPNGRLAWGSTEPSWDVLDVTGAAVHSTHRSTLDWRGVTLAVGRRARSLKVSGQRYLGRPLGLDLARGRVTSGAPDRALSNPRATGLPVADWEDSHSPMLGGRRLSLKRYERSRSLSIASDHSHFALATEWYVRRFEPDGGLRWKTSVPDVAWAVNHSGDGRWIVAAVADGTLRWYRADDGAQLLSVYIHPDRRRWIAWTPGGYYDASPGAEDLLGWHVNRGPDAAADFYPAAQYRDRFFCPAMIPAILDTADEAKALAQVKHECRRMAPEGLTRSMQAPIIEVLEPAAGANFSADTVAVRVRVRSPSGLGVHLDYRVDGRQARAAIDPGPALRDGQTTVLNVPMPERDATIVVLGRTRYAHSEPVALPMRYVGRAPPPPPKPTLYVLAVGVSEYDHDRWNDLTYPASDAARFAAIWKDDPLYAATHIRTLSDGQATWDGIMGGIEWLAENVTARDVAVVYLAGHGKIHPVDSSYAFLPHDAHPRRKLTTWLKQEHYQGPLSALPGKTLLFVDTCHAGAVKGQKVAMRGADLTELINELTDAENGLIVFAASNGRQPAQESPSWGGGAFTRALLTCARERRFDGALTHARLGLCVRETVLQLTEGDQKVEVVVPPGVGDYPILAR